MNTLMSAHMQNAGLSISHELFVLTSILSMILGL